MECSNDIRSDHKLCYSLLRLNRLCLGSVIVECNHDFPPVIRIHNSNLIGRCKPLLGCQTASRIHKSCKSLRYLHGYTRVNHHRLSRLYSNRLIKTRIQIRPRCVL